MPRLLPSGLQNKTIGAGVVLCLSSEAEGAGGGTPAPQLPLRRQIWCSLSPEAEGVGRDKFCRIKEQKTKFSRGRF